MSAPRPVGVFDAGLGAYGVVRALRRARPDADVVYLADRASFPYGRKSRDELLTAVAAGARELERRGCAAVVVASNAPSVTVLPEVAAQVSVPVVGVLPPVREALSKVAGEVVVLGAASMVASPELDAYLDDQAGPERARVSARAAGELIALVESAAFVDEAERTQVVVDAYVRSLRRDHPGAGALTLSSTHLPWLRPFLERSAPGLPLLDPADDAVRAVAPIASDSGSLTCLVTERAGLPASAFTRALRRLTEAAGEPAIAPEVVAPLS